MTRWRKIIESCPSSALVPAIELYGGGIWNDLRSNYRKLRLQGIEVRIVSAGLGLLSPEDRVPAYDATFSPGAKNAIADRCDLVARNREWWSLLSAWSGPWRGPRTIHANVRKHPSAAHLVTLPIDYLDATIEDVMAVLGDKTCCERVVVVTSPYSGAARRITRSIEVSGDLYGALGGTRGTVLARTGLYLATRLKLQASDMEAVKASLGPLYAMIKPLPVRRVQSDAKVSLFIRSALRSKPDLSHSKLLTRFRAKGFACEQSRFRVLHAAVKATL